MATTDKPRKGCQCGNTVGRIEYDRVSNYRLCDICWAMYDPRLYGYEDPQSLPAIDCAPSSELPAIPSPWTVNRVFPR